MRSALVSVSFALLLLSGCIQSSEDRPNTTLATADPPSVLDVRLDHAGALLVEVTVERAGLIDVSGGSGYFFNNMGRLFCGDLWIWTEGSEPLQERALSISHRRLGKPAQVTVHDQTIVVDPKSGPLPQPSVHQGEPLNVSWEVQQGDRLFAVLSLGGNVDNGLVTLKIQASDALWSHQSIKPIRTRCDDPVPDRGTASLEVAGSLASEGTFYPFQTSGRSLVTLDGCSVDQMAAVLSGPDGVELRSGSLMQPSRGSEFVATADAGGEWSFSLERAVAANHGLALLVHELGAIDSTFSPMNVADC